MFAGWHCFWEPSFLGSHQSSLIKIRHVTCLQAGVFSGCSHAWTCWLLHQCNPWVSGPCHPLSEEQSWSWIPCTEYKAFTDWRAHQKSLELRCQKHSPEGGNSITQSVRQSFQESCLAWFSRRNWGGWISHLWLWLLFFSPWKLNSGFSRRAFASKRRLPEQFYLFLNFCSSLLGDLKALHQGHVSQEVPRCWGEAREQVVFQCFQGDFEPILLLRELWLQTSSKGESHIEAQSILLLG